MSRRPTGNYSMESSKINLLGERRKGEGEKGRIKKEREKIKRRMREKRKGRCGEEDLKKEKKQKSKDEQTCMEKIYIYSRIATAGKEQQEKQLNTSKIKSKKIQGKKK